jgi:hypothetical protein
MIQRGASDRRDYWRRYGTRGRPSRRRRKYRRPLAGACTPGGIRVSRSVHEQVANKLSVVFSDLGPQDIKNIPQSVHAYRVELEKGVSEQTLIATAEAQLEGLNRQRSAEVPRTLPPRKRNIFGGIGVRLDTPAMGTLVAACLVLLVGGVTWFWTSSREQPVTTVPLSQADLLKILEPFVNTESRTDQAREYAKTKIHRALAYAPVAKATVRTGGWSTQELAAERNIERCNQYFNEVCAIIGMDDIIFLPRPREGWPLKDAPRVHYVGTF